MRALADIALRPNDRRAILTAAQRLRECFPVSQVVLFGSKATGADTAESDIDLLVLTPGPAATKLRYGISDELFKLDLRYDVVLSTIVLSEDEWRSGLISAMPIHREIEEKGCQV